MRAYPEEECVVYATSLYDITRRKLLRGHVIYTPLLDFFKAYDRVHHMGLLAKLADTDSTTGYWDYRDSIRTSESVRSDWDREIRVV